MTEGRCEVRKQVECRASFHVEDVSGEGVAYNLSERGCAISSPVSVPDEGYASLVLQLPGQVEPIHIDLARVRWAMRQEFGLEFRIVSKGAKQQLLKSLALARAA